MIYLVRHGQTDWNLEHRIQGQLDMPLNDTGRAGAIACAKQLEDIQVDRIISSDLSRTKETASIINEFLSLPISFDTRLREVNCGDLQGVIAEEVSNEKWDLLNHEPHKIHAESLADVYKRVKSFFSDIDATQNTLVVTHSGIVRMAMYLSQNPHSFNQEQFEKTALQFKIKNTEIFMWDKAKNFMPIDPKLKRKS